MMEKETATMMSITIAVHVVKPRVNPWVSLRIPTTGDYFQENVVAQDS